MVLCIHRVYSLFASKLLGQWLPGQWSTSFQTPLGISSSGEGFCTEQFSVYSVSFVVVVQACIANLLVCTSVVQYHQIPPPGLI